MGRILLGNNLLLKLDPQLSGITIEWLGWDGSVWDLTTGEQGVALQPGYQGFSMPPIQRFEREGPSVHGSYYTGFRSQTRKLFLPLKIIVGHGVFNGNTWTSLDSRFFRTLRPDKTGTLRVTTAQGQVRELVCRYDEDSEHAYTGNPGIDGWSAYGISLVANQPFWSGGPKEETWGGPGSEDYFGRAEGSGEVHYLSAADTFLTAKFFNAGDVDAYIRWTIKGPFDTVAVGIGGQDIKIPFAITGSQTIVIDTSPLDMRVLRNGTNVTHLLTSPPRYDFIPPESTVNLTIAGTGADMGTVKAELTPLYYRAW